jgi:hypothetical protein
MSQHQSPTGRLPAKLVAEIQAAMHARPQDYRARQLDAYYREHRDEIATELEASGLDHARAMSRADRDVRRQAESAVSALERFAACDPALVHLAAAAELDRVRRSAHGSEADLRQVYRRLRDWGILRTTIKESVRRNRERVTRHVAVDLVAEQQRIVRDSVPAWNGRTGTALRPVFAGSSRQIAMAPSTSGRWSPTRP